MKSGGTFHARALARSQTRDQIDNARISVEHAALLSFKFIAPLFPLQVSSVVRLQLTSHCFSFERNQPLLSSLSPIKVIKDKLMSK